MNLLKRIRKELSLLKLAFNKREFSLREKLFYYRMLRLVSRKKNIVAFRYDRLATEYTQAYFGIKNVSDEDKLWAINRGLNPTKYGWYGMNRQNANLYLSDFDFYKSSTYVDNTYVEFFENKLNTWFLLSPFKKSMPKHFWYIKNGNEILPLDISDKKNGSISDIIKLLDCLPIAAKACRGGHGIGFYLLEKKANDRYAINRKECSKEELQTLLSSLKDYIITEYNYPHSSLLKKIGDDSFAVMRLVTYYDQIDGPQIVSAIVRIGCKESGVVTDYHGTIYCGLTIKDGKTFKPIFRESDLEYKPIKFHPDTQEDLEGGIEIPKWKELKDLVLSISRYLPFTPYLVMDIIPTENGFSILEINSHGQIRNMEAQYPGLMSKYIRKHFEVDN